MSQQTELVTVPGLRGRVLDRRGQELAVSEDAASVYATPYQVKNPERNLPRALMLGTSAVVAIYLLVNAAYLYLLPIGQMAHSPLVAADAAQIILGRLGVGLVAVVVMVATFSTLLGSMLTARF